MAEFVQMPSTLWTEISRARREGGAALNDLLNRYRSPILAFVKNAVFDREEAEDLTQEVFVTILQDDILAKADKARGKFRSLLLAVTRHTLSAKRRHDGRLKRGGGAKTRSLEGSSDPDGPRLEEMLAATETDDAFDSLWVQNLVRLGMNRLREECEKARTPYFQALLLQTQDRLANPEIAARLGVKAQDVKNYLHQARLRLKALVQKEVHLYSSSREEYESEIAYLMRYLV